MPPSASDWPPSGPDRRAMPAFQYRLGSLPHLFPEDRRLRYCGAVSTRVGCAIIDARCGVVHDRLSGAEEVGVVGADIDLVAPGGKLLADSSGNTLSDPHFASARIRIHEARGIERLLDIHPEIDDVGDELRVRLGLIA